MRKYPYAEERERFEKDVADFKMTVVLEQGLHRHLKFRETDRRFGSYWFDIVTWPGVLVFRGDMGCFVFSRIEDMFQFFHGPHINPGYWGEKLQGDVVHKRYEPENFETFLRDSAKEYIRDNGLLQKEQEDLWDAVNEVLEWEDYWSADAARRILDDFDCQGLTFSDTWELDFKDYTYHYLWACYAIQYAIAQYKKEKNESLQRAA